MLSASSKCSIRSSVRKVQGLNASCVELPLDLSTPPILETLVTVMNASCDQTTEIPTILSAPIELTIDAKEPMFNHFDMTSNLGDDSV